MTSLVFLSCLVFSWPDPPPQEPARHPVSPAELVEALETAIADAIAKAEPSVVAIHRFKGENTQETLAVRGRKSPVNMLEPTRRFGLERLQRIPKLSHPIWFDFGSKLFYRPMRILAGHRFLTTESSCLTNHSSGFVYANRLGRRAWQMAII